MHHFFFDASALVKRYHQESGSEVVNYVLDNLLGSAPERAIISSIVLSETISVLSRKHNANRIPTGLFHRASARLLFTEDDLVVVASDLRLLRAAATEELSALNPAEASLKDAEALLHG